MPASTILRIRRTRRPGTYRIIIRNRVIIRSSSLCPASPFSLCAIRYSELKRMRPSLHAFLLNSAVKRETQLKEEEKKHHLLVLSGFLT